MSETSVAQMQTLQQAVEQQVQTAEQKMGDLESQVARLETDVELLPDGPERQAKRRERDKARHQLYAARGEVERGQMMLRDLKGRLDGARWDAARAAEDERRAVQAARNERVARLYPEALKLGYAFVDVLQQLKTEGQGLPRQLSGLVDGLVELERFADSHRNVTGAGSE